MPYLLNLVYVLLILAGLPWLVWQAVRKGKYREGYAEKFLGRVPRRDPGDRRPCLWLHAVSVGEVNLLPTLIRHLGQRHPNWQCVISTTTKTGIELARKKYPNLPVCYCPLDFSWAVRSAMRRVRPDVLVLAELELWPNLVRAAREHGARVAVINGRLGERSFRGYRRIGPLVRRLLAGIDVMAVQDETIAARFRQLGARPETVHVTGSLKYDGAQTDRANPATERLRQLAGFARDDVVFLAGSTQEPEEKLALATYRTLSGRWPQLRLVLVPRHPDRFEAVARLLDGSGLPWQRRTALGGEGSGFRVQGWGFRVQGSGLGVQGSGLGVQGSGLAAAATPRVPPVAAATPRQGIESTPTPNFQPPARILLVDTVGELGAWWGTAQIAFVGGSLGSRGGQNMIEPAAYGAAVSFGPNTWNFRDIVAAMLARRAAVVIRDGDELTAFVRRALEDPAWAADLGRRAQALVAEQLGATERTLDLLEPLVAPRSDGAARDRSAA